MSIVETVSESQTLYTTGYCLQRIFQKHENEQCVTQKTSAAAAVLQEIEFVLVGKQRRCATCVDEYNRAALRDAVLLNQ